MLTSNSELINTQLKTKKKKNAMNLLALYVNEQQGAGTAEDKNSTNLLANPQKLHMLLQVTKCISPVRC